MYNASKTLTRMLHSLYGQSYSNWQLYLIDDVSEYDEQVKCAKIISQFKFLSGDCKKTIVKWNKTKKWEVANVLYGLSESAENDSKGNDIICRIDADDWLTDLDALQIINDYYNQTQCDIAWTAHRWAFSDKNISSNLPDDANPYQYPWVTSHLKTFRRYLLNNVSDENYRGIDGNYIQRAGDQAIYLPALYNAKKRLFIPRVMYHYTITDIPETYQTDDAKFQLNEANFIRKRGYLK